MAALKFPIQYWIACGTVAVMLSGAVLFAGACSKKPASPAKPQAKAAAPAEKKAERGPVKLVVRAEKSEFSIADNLRATFTVEAEPGVEVQMPQFGENFGEFVIKDYRQYGPEVTAQKKNRWRQEYELEVYYSGEFKIPPVKVKFLDKRTGARKTEGEKGRGGEGEKEKKKTGGRGDAGTRGEEKKTGGAEAASPKPQAASTEPEWNELQTEEMTVKATSVVLPKEEVGKIKDIAGPVSLPRPSFLKRFGLLIGIVAVAAIGAGVALVLLRRKREIRKQMMPAHVLAFRMLEWLIAQDFLRQGNVELFYVYLCGVVRRYIEMRFNVHAPEETTEEFLAQVSDKKDTPLAQHQPLLKDFLEHADLVKFARHQPDEAEVQRAFDSAKNFIQATADDTVLVEAASAVMTPVMPEIPVLPVLNAAAYADTANAADAASAPQGAGGGA